MVALSLHFTLDDALQYQNDSFPTEQGKGLSLKMVECASIGAYCTLSSIGFARYVALSALCTPDTNRKTTRGLSSVSIEDETVSLQEQFDLLDCVHRDQGPPCPNIPPFQTEQPATSAFGKKSLCLAISALVLYHSRARVPTS